MYTKLPCLLTLGLALSLLAVAAACGGGDKKDADTARAKNGSFANKDLGLSFNYPKSWQDVSDRVRLQVEGYVTVLDHVAIGKFDDKLGLLTGVQVSVVQITHQVKPENIDSELMDLDALFKTTIQKVAGRQKDPEFAELGGKRARQYVMEFAYSAANQQVEVASAQTVTLVGDRQYTVNCQGPQVTFDADVLPGCEQIVQTLQLK